MSDQESSLVRLNRWPLLMSHPILRWHIYQGTNNDCGPYCAAMAINTLKEEQEVAGETLAFSLSQYAPSITKPQLPSRVENWATFPWGIVRAVQGAGLQARWRVFRNTEQLRQNLRQGRITIVLVGQPLHFKGRKWQGWSHYKLLYAWHPNEGWAFVDPAATLEKHNGVSFQSSEEFQRQWSWMGRQLIEIW
ncbi:MAG: hypothetical protein JW981_09435, partial [Anaerolineae bacterium]|nr:hypothetical protein [Anaerolineae bacterium]